jgi:hypothetical protein
VDQVRRHGTREYEFDRDGAAPGEALECTSAHAAIARAETLSRKEGHVGAVAFSRSGDPASGEFGDAVLLKAFGEVSKRFEWPVDEQTKSRNGLIVDQAVFGSRRKF